MEVYADVLFFINLFMDFVILWTTSKLMRLNAKLYRICFGALAMAFLYCVLIFCFVSCYNVFTTTFILLSGIVITFTPKHISLLLKLMLMTYIVSFCIAGLTLALSYYVDISLILTATQLHFSINTLVISTVISFVVIKYFIWHVRKAAITNQLLCTLTITMGKEKTELIGLVDTGNSLIDTTNQKPVIIVQYHALNEILYTDFENDIQNQNLQNVLEKLNGRLISFKSVGNQSGLIISFTPDSILIDGFEKTAVIGICNFDLSNDNTYQALINPDLISKMDYQKKE